MLRLLLVAAGVLISGAGFAASPSEAVKFFYGPPLQYEPDIELRGRFVDPAKAIFEQNDKSLANDQEVPCLEASPGIDAQDYDETELARTLELTETVDGDNATVTARFTLFPGSTDDTAKREMRWSLKQVDGAWLVSDIESVTGGWKLSDVKCELSN
jgi:hypothetical protein